MIIRTSLFFLAFLLGVETSLFADDFTVVHEWGTFTSFQDEKGEALARINVDDEPVPSFVHEISNEHIPQTICTSNSLFGLPPYYISKGIIAASPQVTLRLETPVLYFYPPQGQSPAARPVLSVHVDFKGGILSQFYPYANSKVTDNAPNLPTPQTVSSLTWPSVHMSGSEDQFEKINEAVWTTPRKVTASPVTIEDPTAKTSETEKFLFYRGIGHLDSPLRVLEDKGKVTVHVAPGQSASEFKQAWLVEIRPDRTMAFRELAQVDGATSDFFTSTDFSKDHFADLKAHMHQALMDNGLYDDEATAMLNTWQLSYFNSPGLRLFYLVPRSWTDAVLPLSISGGPTKITRVMIGRVELISQSERDALARLRIGPAPDLKAFVNFANGNFGTFISPPSVQDLRDYTRGLLPLSDFMKVPSLIQDYLNLGRFRDVLVLREQEQNPSPELAKFIKASQIGQ